MALAKRGAFDWHSREGTLGLRIRYVSAFMVTSITGKVFRPRGPVAADITALGLTLLLRIA
jgi:hypothetical protein